MSTFNELIDFTRSTTGTYLDSVVYGDELVTNGTFATDSDWVKGTGWSISGGVGVANGVTSQNLRQNGVALEGNKVYSVTFTIVSISQGSVLGRFGGTPTVDSVAFNAAGTYTFFLKANSTNSSFMLRGQGGFTGTVDNISVKEIIGGQVSGTPLLRTAAINEPRLEYDASGNPLGLLIEEARTNVLQYSEDFAGSYWSKGRATITPNAATAPDGTLTADKIISTAVNGSHYVLRSVSASVGTVSVFAKAGEFTFLKMATSANSFAPSFFNLSNGTIASKASSHTATITDAGDGWYRCSITPDNPFGSASVENAGNSASSAHLGNGINGIYIWGAQIETGAFPTSYIPTTGSTVTRAKDIASLPVEKFAYNQDQGSIVCHFNYFFESGNSKRTYEFSDALSANVIRMLDHNNVNQLQANVKFGGAGVAGILINAPTMLSGVKTFQSYKLNGYSGGADGTLAGTDSNGALPIGINKLSIGSNRVGGATMNGHITSLQYYPKKLTNEELELLTQPSASPTMNLTFDGQATSTLVEGLHD